jgi:hypothetical protein
MQLISTSKSVYPKSLILLVALFLVPMLGFSISGNPGSIKYLQATNGFNGIVLGSDISEIPQYKLSYLENNSLPDSDGCVTYEYKDSTTLKMANNLNLDMVTIRTYKNKIVNIYLFFDKHDSYKILSDFLTQYGQFNDKPYEYTDIYNWNTSNVNLSLKYAAKINEGIAVFTNNPLVAEIQYQKQLEQNKSALTMATYLACSVVADTQSN